jgi:hypothetical protein
VDASTFEIVILSSRSSNELSEILETLVTAEEFNGFLRDVDYSGNLAFQ